MLVFTDRTANNDFQVAADVAAAAEQPVPSSGLSRQLGRIHNRCYRATIKPAPAIMVMPTTVWKSGVSEKKRAPSTVAKIRYV